MADQPYTEAEVAAAARAMHPESFGPYQTAGCHCEEMARRCLTAAASVRQGEIEDERVPYLREKVDLALMELRNVAGAVLMDGRSQVNLTEAMHRLEEALEGTSPAAAPTEGESE